MNRIYWDSKDRVYRQIRDNQKIAAEAIGNLHILSYDNPYFKDKCLDEILAERIVSKDIDYEIRGPLTPSANALSAIMQSYNLEQKVFISIAIQFYKTVPWMQWILKEFVEKTYRYLPQELLNELYAGRNISSVGPLENIKSNLPQELQGLVKDLESLDIEPKYHLEMKSDEQNVVALKIKNLGEFYFDPKTRVPLGDHSIIAPWLEEIPKRELQKIREYIRSLEDDLKKDE